MMKSCSCFKLCLLMLVLAGAPAAWARDVVDMSGRTVSVPEKIERAFAVSPPGTHLLYALDQRVIVGLNFPLWENEKKFMSPEYQALPVIGGMVGQGRNLNQEVLMAARPDVVILWSGATSALMKNYEVMFTRMGIPWFNIRLDTLDDYPQAIHCMGKLLGRPERAGRLEAYAVQTLDRLKSVTAGIRETDKPRVYYAEGVDGLATEPCGSMHTELIELCGGVNVHRSGSADKIGYGMDRVSVEQVMLYNPDVILIKEKEFYDRVYRDPRWRRIKAVREERCYLIPTGPFNWFDRPPSFMRLLGGKWLITLLHPKRWKLDMESETIEFYRLFLGVELSRTQAGELLGI